MLPYWWITNKENGESTSSWIAVAFVHSWWQSDSVFPPRYVYSRHAFCILLYGSKTWTLLAEDSRRLQSFHMSCQWQILWVKCYDHIKNSAIAATTSLPNVNDITAKRRLALFGHVMRLDANTPALQILKQAVDVKSGHRPNAQWRRPPGRPRQLLLAAD